MNPRSTARSLNKKQNGAAYGPRRFASDRIGLEQVPERLVVDLVVVLNL